MAETSVFFAETIVFYCFQIKELLTDNNLMAIAQFAFTCIRC